MISISVQHNLDEVMRTLTAIEREAIPRALPSALNATGRQAESAIVKIVAKIMGANQQSVRKRVYRRLARRNDPVVTIEFVGSKVNIASFSGTKQRKKGVSSKAFGVRRIYPRTFLINDGRTAMKRIGTSRLPIRPVFGPGIAREAERHRKTLEAVAAANFEKNLDHALRAALAGYIK